MISDLIKARRNLSDLKLNKNREHKESIKAIDTDLDKIDCAIMTYLQDNNIESVKTDSGTAFVDTKDKINIADSLEFKQFLTETFLLALQQHKYVNEDGLWKPALHNLPNGKDILAEDVARVMQNNVFDILTLQANKNSCKEFMRNNDGRMPAGINYTTFKDIKVRK